MNDWTGRPFTSDSLRVQTQEDILDGCTSGGILLAEAEGTKNERVDEVSPCDEEKE